MGAGLPCRPAAGHRPLRLLVGLAAFLCLTSWRGHVRLEQLSPGAASFEPLAPAENATGGPSLARAHAADGESAGGDDPPAERARGHGLPAPAWRPQFHALGAGPSRARAHGADGESAEGDPPAEHVRGHGLPAPAWRPPFHALGGPSLARAHGTDGESAGHPAGAAAKTRAPTPAAEHARDGPTQRPRQRFLYLDELTHFLSHIPKSGTEYAGDELNRLLRTEFRLPDNRTLRQVSRAQGRFNATSFRGDFFAKHASFDYASFPSRLARDAGSDAYAPPSVCNMAKTPLARLPPHRVLSPQAEKIRFQCVLHETEQPWSAAARHAYTIVREPVSHVLSQYFHCTESPQHKQRELMPPLTPWLQAYFQLKRLNLTEERLHQRALILEKKYNCYNPIDSESKFTAFEHRLPEGYTYPYPDQGDSNERDEATQQLDRKLFDDLKQKYRVIGDTTQMVKTVCAIFISFAGQVPKVCDCTERRDDDGGDNRTGQFCLRNLHTHPDPPAPRSRRGTECVKIGYDRERHSHGVRHHGSSFAVTLRQRKLISDLRRRDLVLYNVSRAVFARQVAELEARHGVRVCARWNRHEGTWPAP